MPGNTVHTYCTGNTFPNIYGGQNPAMFGYISHIKYMTPLMNQRWPWMKGMWALSDHKFTYGHFKTLREAKQYAKELWPSCEFKTPKQF